jgi:hypothetical protein
MVSVIDFYSITDVLIVLAMSIEDPGIWFQGRFLP